MPWGRRMPPSASEGSGYAHVTSSLQRGRGKWTLAEAEENAYYYYYYYWKMHKNDKTVWISKILFTPIQMAEYIIIM